MSQQLAAIEQQIIDAAALRQATIDARVTQICCGPTENGCEARVTQICCGPTENGCEARVTQICCGPTENGCEARVTQICCGPTENGCEARVTQICCGPTENGCDNSVLGAPATSAVIKKSNTRKFQGSLQQVLALMPAKSG
jgi:regulation of enolase protein 1 (concanavalin A-like superfamily)